VGVSLCVYLRVSTSASDATRFAAIFACLLTHILFSRFKKGLFCLDIGLWLCARNIGCINIGCINIGWSLLMRAVAFWKIWWKPVDASFLRILVLLADYTGALVDIYGSLVENKADFVRFMAVFAEYTGLCW